MASVIDPAESRPAAVDAAGEGPSGSRYALLEPAGERCLAATASPSIKLHVERGLAVTARTRRRYPKQSIFLDGVFTGAPFLDHGARQYSLDHHSGCIRPFTLAACEQAVAMLLWGVPLDEGEWHLYVNEPDLDAVLAAWVLLNHLELRRDGGRLLERVMPFIRVEGVIDAHGLERTALSGLSPEAFAAERARIDALLAEERAARSSGAWSSIDPLGYVHGVLERLDRALLPEALLRELLSAETVEVARAAIQQHKLALLCRSDRGIYAVESELKRRYEDRLAVIVLDQGGDRFTVRQVDAFLTRNLDHLYRLLNREDPKVLDDNRWGGSAEIGGAPRQTGSGLSGSSVLALVAEEYAEGGWLQRAWRRVLARRWWPRWRAVVASLMRRRR